MKFSLIICTYMRPRPLKALLDSVAQQTLPPNEIVVVDGSTNAETEQMLAENPYSGLRYYRVDDDRRGLTKQRNFGIELTSEDIEVVCFLDDDTVLETSYFQNLIETYKLHPDAAGAGGYITNESHWEEVGPNHSPAIGEFAFDGWKRMDGDRFILRKKLGLAPDRRPGFMPEFSHGRSIGFLPPSGEVYRVEQLMGGVSSFRKSIFTEFSFSEYFEGYGLYEDADFTLRVSKKYPLYVNTSARLAHYHDEAGRPNRYAYGKMVIRNGWYVWRVKHSKPSLKARLKWHAVALLLTLVRFTNIFTTKSRKQALTESVGRFAGWLSILVNPPKISRS